MPLKMFIPRTLYREIKTKERALAWESVLGYLDRHKATRSVRESKPSMVIRPATKALRRLTREKHKFQASLCCPIRQCLKESGQQLTRKVRAGGALGME